MTTDPDPKTIADTDLTAWQLRLEAAEGEEAFDEHERFLGWLGDRVDCAVAPEAVERFAPTLRARHGWYLGERERVRAAALVRTPPAGSTLRERIGAGFGQQGYDRMASLAALVGDAPRNVAMVGCGALPSALFFMADCWPGMRATGIDIDRDRVDVARDLAGALGAEHIDFDASDGADRSYAGFDLVYVANLVAPKHVVLAAIARTAAANTVVVVREPVGPGVLLAESAMGSPTAGFRQAGAGQTSRAFLSRDVLLRRDG